jgi:hypothetical protein
MLCGDLRLSQRKKTMRPSLFKRVSRPSPLAYSTASHVKFNAEANRVVLGAGGGKSGGEGQTRMRLHSALNTSMFE